MTRKSCFTLALALMAVLSAWGQKTISSADALKLAKQVWPASRDGKTTNPELAYEAKNDTTDHPYYYIFNKGNNEGFVIISADSRNKKILAYSNTGHFDINTAPPEMKAWLGAYEEALSDLSLMPDSILKMNLRRERKNKVASRGVKLANSVAPLLGDIQYSQEYPYNAKCPWNSVTGCVATGAVQIMRYHQYPKKPSGKSHSYNLNGSTIGTNYTTYYDWANMLTSYKNNNGNNRQNEAISQLMFDAGVACDMEYTPQESGANTALMAKSMNSYFGYDADMTIYERKFFTESEFVYFLKRELSAGRPVLFSGRGNSGGHCFVCDGYDKNGFFHFNWGWNGLSDGYYQITNLCPGQYSTGGGNGSYNQEVSFIGGIRPSEGNTLHNQLLGISGNINGPSSVSKGGQMRYSFQQVTNSSMSDFNGQFGVALYKDGSYVRTIGSTQANLKVGYYYTDFYFTIKFPTDVANGEYELVFVCKANNDKTWHPALAYKCNSQKCVVSGSKATLTWNNSSRRIDLYFNDADVTNGKTEEINTLDIKKIAPGEIEDEIKKNNADDDDDDWDWDDDDEDDDDGDWDDDDDEDDEDDEDELEDANSFYGV